jgi:hypothetical protein
MNNNTLQHHNNAARNKKVIHMSVPVKSKPLFLVSFVFYLYDGDTWHGDLNFKRKSIVSLLLIKT